ncbi:proline-rich protein 2-like [Moschus berezovskii]|uniref:proline-rich protein 2-like n=1 Tax=Moschus berezovskii TaxID=68408 RepID=UPI0024445D72|nr:proline-rich protein 2-like [Moschus berezovskii]
MGAAGQDGREGGGRNGRYKHVSYASRRPLSAASDGHSEEAAPPGSPRARPSLLAHSGVFPTPCSAACAPSPYKPGGSTLVRLRPLGDEPLRRGGRLRRARRLLPPVRGGATRGRRLAGTIRPGHGPASGILRDRRGESPWAAPHPPLRGPAARGRSRALSRATQASAPGARERAHPPTRPAGASRPSARPSAAGRPGSPHGGGRAAAGAPAGQTPRFRSEKRGAAASARQEVPPRGPRGRGLPSPRPRRAPRRPPPAPSLHPRPRGSERPEPPRPA